MSKRYHEYGRWIMCCFVLHGTKTKTHAFYQYILDKKRRSSFALVCQPGLWNVLNKNGERVPVYRAQNDTVDDLVTRHIFGSFVVLCAVIRQQTHMLNTNRIRRFQRWCLLVWSRLMGVTGQKRRACHAYPALKGTISYRSFSKPVVFQLVLWYEKRHA